VNRVTTAYPAEGSRGAFAATGRGDTEKIFRAARRHSRRVRWLRVGVPVGIALALLSVVVANYMPPLGGFRLPGELGKLVIKGTKITMEQPRLTGFTNDARAYEFTARAAAQDITKPDLMELHQLYAKMEMQDKNTVEMSARMGLYDIKGEILRLSDQIVLTSSSGYEGRLSEAVIDVHKGTVVSEKPVVVKMLNGLLNANRLEVADNGEVIRFDGGVSMTLILGGQEKAGQP
jgi:lipopolysaccharide export system protein LptC